MDVLPAEKMSSTMGDIDTTPLGTVLVPQPPEPKPGVSALWIGRYIDPSDLAIGLLIEAQANGWKEVFGADDNWESFTSRMRFRAVPPFWIIRDHQTFYGLQLSPRAYDGLRVVSVSSQGVVIEAYAIGAARMLRTISQAPWICSLRQRSTLVKFMDRR